MNTELNARDLRRFEDRVAETFDSGNIRAPVHLYSGNEENMIQIFKNIQEDDWVMCSWRSHYQCLLKGVPKDVLKEAILQGRSISLCFKDYKVLCSGIVTGAIPIAVGTALDIKRKKQWKN